MNKARAIILAAVAAVAALTAPQIAGAQQYWQQRVNYNIDVTLQDSDHSLQGNIQIQYFNNSPDTLTYIWIHCWPNAYKNDRTAFSEQRLGNGQTDFYFSDKDQKGYINHLEFRVDGQLAEVQDHPQYIDIIRVILPTPLASGGQVTITTPFHVQLPYDFSRSGYYQGSYQVAQWYPKPAVYDSHGWHPIPYLDQGEFYSEFGDFDVHITVPKSFIVAATGELQDVSGQLGGATIGGQRIDAGDAGRQESGPPPSLGPSPTQPSAHRAALKTPPATHSARPSAAKGMPTAAPATTTHATTAHPSTAHSPAPLPPEPTKTLHYHQNNIHDFAWFADRNFHTEHDTLQLSSGRIIDVYSFYTSSAIPAWHHSIEYIKDAVRFRSALIGEYPFNVVTVAETYMGFSGGMEYPTITNIHIAGSAKDLDATIEHEVGHNWFYAILGTNERRFPWMDEGINTYYDNRYMAWKYPSFLLRDASSAAPPSTPSWLQKKIPDNLYPMLINTQAAIKADQPISLPAADFTPWNYNIIAYAKTGIWMKTLEDTLGTPLFDSCMRQYFRTWQFRHPYPEDFKAVLTSTSQRNLDTIFSLLDKTGPLPPFPPHRTIRPTLLFNLRNADKIDYLNILPALGYNKYDQVMIGALIHNFNFPADRWQMLLAPLYATGTRRLNGAAHFGYSWYPSRSFRLIETGVNASRFSTSNGVDSNGHQLFGGFYKVVPFVRLFLPKSSPRITQDAWLEWKTYLIGEKELGNYVQKSTDSIFYPTVSKYNFRYLNQLSFTIRDERALYPYKVSLQVQQAAPFYRVNLTGNYFFNYEKGGGLDVRVFGAKFGYLSGIDPSQDLTPYEPKLTGVRGIEDYTYDNYFIGRNEFNGGASQQIMLRDGDLKLRTDLFQGLQGRSDNWVASLNLSTTLPRQIFPQWIPLKAFLDVGTYSGAWSANPPTSHFLYVGGLELNFFKDVLHVFAPLVYSSDFSNQLKTVPGQNGFFQKLSFSIDFENINFRKVFGNTPF